MKTVKGGALYDTAIICNYIRGYENGQGVHYNMTQQ